MVVMKDSKVIMDLNDTEVGAGVGVITSETNGAAAPPPGATAEFAAEGGAPIPSVNNNNVKDKSERLTVTFDPNPTILLTNTDGSPLKMGDLKRGDGSAALTKGANGQSGQQQQATAGGRNPDVPADCYLKELYTQITAVVTSNPDDREAITDDECTDPSAVPVIWVSKWVDYSDKYGLGYQLCDDSIGVLFNDFTKLLLLSDGETIRYIERTSAEHQHHLKNYPPALNKKVTLLRYFRNYMNEHLLKAAASMCPREGDDKFQIPSLRTYFRTRSAIILHLTNGILQINFFEDHTKIILCPVKGAVTYIDEKRNFRTYKMTSLVKNGCRQDLANRLRYARNMIQKLLVTKAFTLRAAAGANSSSSASATASAAAAAAAAAAGQQHTTQTATA